MEETKYYTPELWEFCEGFEFSLNRDLKNFQFGNIDHLLLVKNRLKDIKVKCLDKSDIESLGFVKKQSPKGIEMFAGDNFDIYVTQQRVSVIGTKSNYLGKIRNKFHLQQILKDIC